MTTATKVCLFLTLSLCLGWTCPAAAEDAPQAGKAVVIWDELRIDEPQGLTSTPTPKPPNTLARARGGDLLLLLGEQRRGRVRVQLGDVVGWAYARGMVELAAPRADAEVLAAALEQEQPLHWAGEPNDLLALALYSRHLELFPASRYRALARYRFGQVADRLAVEATKEIDRALEEKREESGGEMIEWEALEELGREHFQKYERWGISFKYSRLGGYYYYGGETYRALVADYPDSRWADEAAYELLNPGRSEVGEWEGYPGFPLEELEQWQAFLARYPASELRPQALLRMVYLHRALYEIFLISPEETVRDEAQAREQKQAAEELAARVVEEFPETEHAVEAETHLAGLARGEHVYIFPPPAAKASASGP